MTRLSNSSDAGSHHSQLSQTVVGSPQESPSDPCFSRSQISPPPPCPKSNYPNNPLACRNLKTTPQEPVPGWPEVSELMSETPEFASFNRFSDLQIKSLLYYQAELQLLKNKLKKEEWEDYRRGDEDASKFCKRANYLVSSDSKQWKTIKEIREVLKEYNEALLQYSQVSALPKPATHNMTSFVKWLGNPEDGDMSIGGAGEQNTWGNLYGKTPPPESLWKVVRNLAKPNHPCSLDLALSTPEGKVDSFTAWVKGSLLPWWGESFWKKKWTNKRKLEGDAEQTAEIVRSEKPRAELAKETLTKYSEEGISRVTSFLTTMVACLLPTIAITVLSQVHGLRNLLLCLAGFAIIFAAGLIFLGTASKVEIFGATAAFSAVMVVFISDSAVPTVVVPTSGVPYVVNS